MAQISDELRDLIERNSQIQELTRHPGWPLLVDYMHDRMFKEQRSLILGNARTIEDYRNTTGWLKGVTDTLTAPDALAEQVEREQAKERDTEGVAA